MPILCTVVLIIALGSAHKALGAAGINETITVQGRLVDGDGTNVSASCVSADSCDFRFTIWSDPSAGSNLWQETQSDIEVNDGIFNVKLGSVTTLDDTDLQNFNRDDLYIAIEFDPDGDGDFAEGETFSPRIRLASVPYAFNSKYFDGEPSSSYLRADANDTFESGFALTFDGDTDFNGDLTISDSTITFDAASTTFSQTVGDLAFSATGSITFNTEPILAGAARHSRKIQLNAEYPGAVLTSFYGSGTDTSTSGTMTSDAEPSADNLRSYYQWESSETTLQYYTVAVRVTLPEDFDAWEATNAIQVDFNTEGADGSDNSILHIYIYNGDDTPGTAVMSSLANAVVTGDTWETISIDDSVIDDDSAPDWDAAGETAVLYFRMGSKDSNFVRIGDIKLNYLSKW